MGGRGEGVAASAAAHLNLLIDWCAMLAHRQQASCCCASCPPQHSGRRCPCPPHLPPPGWLQENFVTFLPNYLRLAAGVLLATFYLRPKALLGAAAVVGSLYRSATLAYRRQQQQQQAAAAAGAAAGTDGRAARQQQQQQPQANAAAGMPVNRRWAAGTDPNEQLVTAATTLLTWLLVAYTRCLPMLMLGSAASLAVVLVHCGVRRAPSEYRHKGRQPLGFTWQQVLGRGECWRCGSGAGRTVVWWPAFRLHSACISGARFAGLPLLSVHFLRLYQFVPGVWPPCRARPRRCQPAGTVQAGSCCQPGGGCTQGAARPALL